MESPAEFLKTAISQEDRDYIRRQGVPSWKFGKLIEAYRRHYGIPANAGNGRASVI